jgi:hypothetical protein
MGKLGLNVVAGVALGVVVFACASNPPEDFVPPETAPDRNSTVPDADGGASSSGGSSGTSSSGGTSGSSSGGTDAGSEAGPTGDCSKMGTVDNRPACDKCTKQKCCTQLQACEASASCKAAQSCIAACASEDFVCILTCSASGGNGGQLLQDVGTCASQQCATECPSDFDFDGGFPF